MGIYLLLIIELLFLAFSLRVTNSDFISVSVVVTLVMIVSTIFNIYAIGLWDNPTFYFETVFTVSLALLAVVAAELVARLLYKKNYIKTSFHLQEISIPQYKVFLVTTCCIVFTILYYLNIRTIGIRVGLNVASAISMIKLNYEDTNMQLNVVIRQGYKIISAFAYICGFVFINNVIVTKKVKKNLIHFVPAVCFAFVCILSGGRIDIIRLFSAYFLYYMILLKEKNEWKIRSQKDINRKLIRKVIPLTIIIAIIMTLLRTITKGNVSTNQLNNILDYIAFYIGGPLQVLNLKIHNGISNYRLDYWGELTFRGIWNFISKLGLTNDYIPLNLSSYEYLVRRLGIGGNTDTFIGPPLFDFGYIGMAIAVFLEYYVICYIYYKKIYGIQASYSANRKIIIYGFCFFVVTISFYENCFYSILSQTGLISIIILWLCYWFYFKVKINLGKI